MKYLLVAALLTTAAWPSEFARSETPSALRGVWKIQRAYDTPGPIGIDESDERLILRMRLAYSGNSLRTCQHQVRITATTVGTLTTDAFLQKYGFLPARIGFHLRAVTEVDLETAGPTPYIGGGQCPGLHVFLDRKGHVVTEVANAYYALAPQ